MATKKPRPRLKLKPPVSEPRSSDEIKAAEEIGASVLALRLHQAAGAPFGHYADYHETVDSLAKVAAAFGVSERTAASWKAKGMPVIEGKKYPLAAIRHWRLRQNDPPEWLYRGSQELPPADATGDLARAILRLIRAEILSAGKQARADFMLVLNELDRDDDGEVEDLFAGILARHFDGFRLDDAEIEKLLVEVWGLV